MVYSSDRKNIRYFSKEISEKAVMDTYRNYMKKHPRASKSRAIEDVNEKLASKYGRSDAKSMEKVVKEISEDKHREWANKYRNRKRNMAIGIGTGAAAAAAIGADLVFAKGKHIKAIGGAIKNTPGKVGKFVKKTSSDTAANIKKGLTKEAIAAGAKNTIKSTGEMVKGQLIGAGVSAGTGYVMSQLNKSREEDEEDDDELEGYEDDN